MIQLRIPLYPVKLLLELSNESCTRWQLDRENSFIIMSHQEMIYGLRNISSLRCKYMGGAPEQRLVGMFLFAGWIAIKRGNIVVEDWTVLLNQGRGANRGEPLPHDSRGSFTGMKSGKTYFFRFRRALTLACFALIILFIRKKAETFMSTFRILNKHRSQIQNVFKAAFVANCWLDVSWVQWP